MNYTFQTPIGAFHIRHNHRTGRFHAFFEDEDLGGYATPAEAAEDLAGGHTFFPSSGIDPSTLGIPADLSDWEEYEP